MASNVELTRENLGNWLRVGTCTPESVAMCEGRYLISNNEGPEADQTLITRAVFKVTVPKGALGNSKELEGRFVEYIGPQHKETGYPVVSLIVHEMKKTAGSFGSNPVPVLVTFPKKTPYVYKVDKDGALIMQKDNYQVTMLVPEGSKLSEKVVKTTVVDLNEFVPVPERRMGFGTTMLQGDAISAHPRQKALILSGAKTVQEVLGEDFVEKKPSISPASSPTTTTTTTTTTTAAPPTEEAAAPATKVPPPPPPPPPARPLSVSPLATPTTSTALATTTPTATPTPPPTPEAIVPTYPALPPESPTPQPSAPPAEGTAVSPSSVATGNQPASTSTGAASAGAPTASTGATAAPNASSSSSSSLGVGSETVAAERAEADDGSSDEEGDLIEQVGDEKKAAKPDLEIAIPSGAVGEALPTPGQEAVHHLKRAFSRLIFGRETAVAVPAASPRTPSAVASTSEAATPTTTTITPTTTTTTTTAPATTVTTPAS